MKKAINDSSLITFYESDYFLNIIKMCENHITTDYSKTVKLKLPQIISLENDTLSEIVDLLNRDLQKHRPKNAIIQNAVLYMKPIGKYLEITSKCDYVEQKINPVRKSDRVY